MTVKLMCVSHTPMMEFCHPPAEIELAARAAFTRLAEEVKAYDPELIVVFGPDHFNGFFYDLMPAACIGVRAQAAGDWDIGEGPISVPQDLALNLVEHVLDSDLDVAYSYKMQADHGITQPLTLLCGDIDRYPTIPVFLNAAASPLAPCRRSVALGRSVGKWLAQRQERILILGSGGLSHDPPTPQMGSVPPEVEQFLISGRNPSAEARATRQSKVVAVGQALSRGEGPAIPLNPEWDKALMQTFKNGNFARLEALSNEEILREGGKGGQEIRAWIAAFAALSEFGDYDATIEYYEPIQEWIAGMGMMTATPVGSK
ncbi:MAG: 3-carboxyethylcatechol 2,3-dioxygenase [Neisseriaceae bacterium]|nr:3-carboxyethylcatechol 2,3-dioxygenase [Neisseriaceae bacterium]